jgi:uncharacterized protein (DUF885 family)
MDDLRAEVEAREAGRFDVRRFHQRALSHGTPTVAMLREALSDDAQAARRPFRRIA